MFPGRVYVVLIIIQKKRKAEIGWLQSLPQV